MKDSVLLAAARSSAPRLSALLACLLMVALLFGSQQIGIAATHKNAKARKADSASAPKDAETADKPKKGSSKASASKKDSVRKSKRAAAESSENSDDEKSETRKSKKTSKTGGKSARSRKPASRHAETSRAARAARTVAIRKAFTASAELRPMAQQLANLRTPEIYAAVSSYARNHTGEASAAAYLALGHAYLADKRYADAQAALRQSRQAGDALADYADYLAARAAHESGNHAAAETLLSGFIDRYPDSVFDAQVPELEASVLLAMGNPSGARKVLAAAQGLAAEDRPGFQFEQGEVALALGERAAAERIFRQLLLARPTSSEAQQSRARLAEMGVEGAFGPSERRTLAEAYYKGGRYADAADQYRFLARAQDLDAAQRASYAAAEAACDWKLKRLTRAKAEALADTDDEAGARRMYLLMELARDRDSQSDQQQIVAQMQTRFPRSPWLAEALFSSGNMYLLKRDYARAATYYGMYAARFPSAKNASLAHWKAGWLNYRLGQFAEASRIFDEQIRLFPKESESISALYWRGRLYESRDHNPAMAVANYRALVRTAPHFFYAQMARQRLAALGNQQAAEEQPSLSRFQALPAPSLVESFPEASPHLAKARLLANAGLTEYLAREIAADPDFGASSALVEAQIYASYGETFRALRAAKRAIPYSASAPLPAIPMVYWRILYPQPWWQTIKAEAARNNLDPYLVASLIRQESEFEPSVVSYANAWGLMQLLPSSGKQMARAEGMGGFQTSQLMDPATNIRLGTRYLKMLMDQFGGVEEYALAAYNAGGNRVSDWESAGPYRGMDEFVESIPFTQTREYVQAILRNKEIYRALDSYQPTRGSEGHE